MENSIVWADIPVVDLDRAIKFYSAVMQQELLRRRAWMAWRYSSAAWIRPDEDGGPAPVSFDLALSETQKPSTQGSTIYLNSHGDPEGMLGELKPPAAKFSCRSPTWADGRQHRIFPRFGGQSHRRT